LIPFEHEIGKIIPDFINRRFVVSSGVNGPRFKEARFKLLSQQFTIDESVFIASRNGFVRQECTG
jgi:hypothetical protein